MSKSNPFVDFYSGTEVQVLHVKDLLQQEGIPSIIQNDFHSGNLGGFLGGTSSTVRLKVQKRDFEKSKILLATLERS